MDNVCDAAANLCQIIVSIFENLTAFNSIQKKYIGDDSGWLFNGVFFSNSLIFQLKTVSLPL